MTNEKFDVGAFTDVDKADDPTFHVRYLDSVRSSPQFSGRKQVVLAAMQLRPGDAALDVGCGTGDDVIAIARIVGDKGRAVGVDLSSTMIDEGRARAAAEGVRAEFHCTDGATLPFPDATFDATCIERVLIHVEDPDAVVREMVRVTRPGGRVVAMESDFGSGLVDCPHREIRRKFTRWVEDDLIRNGWMGRELWRRFHEAGLTDVTAEIQPTTYAGEVPEWFQEQARGFVQQATDAAALSVAEADTYRAWLDAQFEAKTYFSSLGMFLAVGTAASRQA